MTETSSEGPDPLYDWLVLRLEQLTNSQTGEGSPAAGTSGDSILRAVERAEQCAHALTTVWPVDDSAGHTPRDGLARPTGPDHGSPAQRAMLPDSLGRFQIKRLLGRGGMGNVFLAFDPTLERPVALKVPRFDVAGDPELRERFVLEARAAARLSHPNLVEVYDAGLEGSACYIASAYCDGPDLEKWLAARDAPVEAELAARLVAQLAEAIHCCHQAGIIHRDLKPANILLAATAADAATAQGGLPFVPKITDFGLARAVEESLIQTRSSLIVGTPMYMAPEQAEGRAEEIGPATDIFALGSILYELLTGRRPFEGRSALTVLNRIQGEDPESPRQRRRGVPAGLEAICMKCLRKRPTERYASAAQLSADLENWLTGRRISARRFTLWDRFRTWSRQPERVRDAGIAAICWNGVIVLAVLSQIINVLFGVETPLPVVGRDVFVLECLAVGSVHSFFCWVGWRTVRRNRWAYWLGFANSVLMLIAVVNALLGGYAMFHMYEAYPMAKYLMMLHFTILSAFQFLAFLVALWAKTSE